MPLQDLHAKLKANGIDADYYVGIVSDFPHNEWFSPNNAGEVQEYAICSHLHEMGLMERRDLPQYRANGSSAGTLVEFKLSIRTIVPNAEEWHSIEDCFPKAHTVVLAYSDRHPDKVQICGYVNIQSFFSWETHKPFPATHWRHMDGLNLPNNDTVEYFRQ